MGVVTEVRELRAEEAAGVPACFRRCYGDTYPERGFYDAAELEQRIRAGSLRSVAAFDERGDVVGHMALSVQPRAMGGAEPAEVAEAGHTVVDPAFRGQKLVVRLSARLLEACRAGGWSGFVHYPTTAHAIMQKLAVAGGGIETGILLATIPDETRYQGITRDGGEGVRRAVVVVYQPVAPARSRTVSLPERYAGRLASLYRAAGLPRAFASGAAAAGLASEACAVRNPIRRLLRLDVARAGADLVAVATAGVEGADDWLVHLDLPLEQPGAAAQVEDLRALGFFFAALLPGFGSGDVLRLQRLPGGVWPLEEPALESAEARALLALQREDAAER